MKISLWHSITEKAALQRIAIQMDGVCILCPVYLLYVTER